MWLFICIPVAIVFVKTLLSSAPEPTMGLCASLITAVCYIWKDHCRFRYFWCVIILAWSARSLGSGSWRLEPYMAINQGASIGYFSFQFKQQQPPKYRLTKIHLTHLNFVLSWGFLFDQKGLVHVIENEGSPSNWPANASVFNRLLMFLWRQRRLKERLWLTIWDLVSRHCSIVIACVSDMSM